MNPIATALRIKQKIFTCMRSRIIRAITPLIASVITPIISGKLNLFVSNSAFVIRATIEHISRKTNEAAETIVIFFISGLLHIRSNIIIRRKEVVKGVNKKFKYFLQKNAEILLTNGILSAIIIKQNTEG